jgi:nicotinamidase-related amidase
MVMTHHAILSRKNSALVVIDYQDKLVPMVWRSNEILERARLMMQAAPIYNIPIFITEHYPRGLGKTVHEISEVLGDARAFEKVVFSAFGSDEFTQALKQSKVETLVITGIESHICVSQTVHDAIQRGYGVHVISDAISSRNELDHWVGIGKMKEAGAVITSSETALYEIQKQAGNSEFKELLKLVK